jgi:phenylalanyl-tRNA synthetase alpha subunit
MAQEDDKHPKKRPVKKTRPTSRSTRKKTTKSKEELKNEEYKKQIQQALKANLDEYLKNRNLNQKQISSLNSLIEEHLSCFVLVGYTVDGEPLTLVNAQTQKDSDSLGTILQKVLKKYQDPPSSQPLI